MLFTLNLTPTVLLSREFLRRLPQIMRPHQVAGVLLVLRRYRPGHRDGRGARARAGPAFLRGAVARALGVHGGSRRGRQEERRASVGAGAAAAAPGGRIQLLIEDHLACAELGEVQLVQPQLEQRLAVQAGGG